MYQIKLLIVNSLFLAVFLFFATSTSAFVYIYEVTTNSSRFQTASQLEPDSFLYYNGGYDIIYNLKVVAKYPDKDYAKALKDYRLDGKNINNNQLLFRPIPKNIPYRPFYWWR